MLLGNMCGESSSTAHIFTAIQPISVLITSHQLHLMQRNKYILNANQELRGLGLANLAGAAFNCYTTTGSFSRSAVNNIVG